MLPRGESLGFNKQDQRLVMVFEILSILSVIVLVFKLALSSLTLADVMGVVTLLLVSQAARVVDYKYPRRPDLFPQVEELTKKVESLEHDMTGVKFGLKSRH